MNRFCITIFYTNSQHHKKYFTIDKEIIKIKVIKRIRYFALYVIEVFSLRKSPTIRNKNISNACKINIKLFE